MPLPQVTARVYFPGDTDDVSNSVRSLNTRVGRGGPFAPIGQGSATVTLDNTTGEFELESVSHPDLEIGRRAQVGLVIGGTTYWLFTGRVQSHQIQYANQRSSSAQLSFVDDMSRFGAINLVTYKDQYDNVPPTLPQQTVEDRIEELCQCVDPKTSITAYTDTLNIEGASTTLFAVEVTGNMQAELGRIAETDFAIACFFNRLGEFTYLGKYARASATPDFNFTNVATGPTNYQFASAVPSRTLNNLANRVEVYRRDVFQQLGGVPETAADATSVTSYGETMRQVRDAILYPYTPEGDGEAQALADYILAGYKDPIHTISLNLTPMGVWRRTDLNDTQKLNQLAALAQMAPGDVITVDLSPHPGTPSLDDSFSYIVDSVSHSFTSKNVWTINVIATEDANLLRTIHYFTLDTDSLDGGAILAP